MVKNQRKLFWAEAGLSVVTAVLALLTLVSREWIEVLSGWDPDHGDGSLEWAIVVGLATVAVILAVLARLEFRRARPVTPAVDRAG